ncbi:endonuclease [Antarctobacter sp.]|uniref:endonuclease n=1 Tax=Antarctobacter sp. TaxID=1872577 RepID=UPI003A9533FD
MTNTTERGDCPKICWGLAALAALLTFVLLLAVGEWGFFAALVVAVVLLVGLGVLLNRFLCGAPSVPAPRAATATPARAKTGPADPAPEAAPEAPATAVTDAAPAAQERPRVAPSTPLAGEAELAERKGEWRYTGAAPAARPQATPEPTPDPVIEATPDPVAPPPSVEPVAETPEDAGPRVLPSTPLAGQAELASRKGTWVYTAPAAEPTAAPMGEDYDRDGIFEGKDEGEKPAMLDAPRDGGADDLKQVKGIGAKLEQLCHSLGIYHFDQIANWTDQEIAWVDANLEGFKGRVSRDQWVAQARVLAEGGQTEFSSRVKDGDVY